jgi:GNAT superfamily N-acetyltransferase
MPGPPVTDLRIVPANEAPWDDIRAIFGGRGSAPRCWCQRYKLAPKEAFSKFPAEEREARLRVQTNPSDPAAASTTGLVAYLDEEPVGWVAVQPRPAYPGLLRVYRVPWDGRSEDKADGSVWSITCFLVRAGFRRRGIAHALAVATVAYTRDRGARALEGYPMLTQPGQDVVWDEIHVGARRYFDAAGFTEVSHPTTRRVVMRIDF